MNRGDIYFANLASDSEISGFRPVVILSNSTFTPTVLIAPITGNAKKRRTLPTHVKVNAGQGGLQVDGLILLEQIRAISKDKLVNKVGTLNKNVYDKVLVALSTFFGLEITNQQVSETKLKNLEIDLAQQYNQFYSLLKATSDNLDEFRNDFANAGSLKSKIKEWLIGGVIGAILGVLASLVFDYFW